MNLYEINFKHFAPKDSEQGILTYLYAKTDNDVYAWLKTDPILSNGRSIYTNFEDNEEEGGTFEIYDNSYKIIGHETYKERIIRLRGEINDESVELDDLFYGQTLIGWKKVGSNISLEQIEAAKDLGINIESA
ncbi:hypothetical protein U1F82_18895, partial [Bacillus sp. SXabc123]|nr:hypothetical protein [Bacillus sp. SXabc123]